MMNETVSKDLVKKAINDLCDCEGYSVDSMTKEERLNILGKAKESFSDAIKIISAMELQTSKKK